MNDLSEEDSLVTSINDDNEVYQAKEIKVQFNGTADESQSR